MSFGIKGCCAGTGGVFRMATIKLQDGLGTLPGQMSWTPGLQGICCVSPSADQQRVFSQQLQAALQCLWGRPFLLGRRRYIGQCVE